jgi:hypothetical protein
MALPKLNDQPKFNLKVPSTQEEMRFRPFLVKEEKVLLIALESKDEQAMMQAIADTIESCAQSALDTDKLTSFDIEYLFTQLRGKSVGETIKLNAVCDHCQGETEYNVNVDEIKMYGGTTSNVVKISDNIELELQYPQFSRLKKEVTASGLDQADGAATAFAMIKACIKAVLTEEERIEMEHEDPKAVDEFVESMSSEQFQKISEFVEDVPKMKHTMNWKCEHCGTENTKELSGMQAFFS